MDTLREIIKDGDNIVLKTNKTLKVITVRRQRTIYIEKAKVNLDALIGCPFGSSFELVNGLPILLEFEEGKDEEDEDPGADVVGDNRDLLDTSDNQKLTKEDIVALKNDGLLGEDIINRLVENSATFSGKTEYSKEKYIQKKTKKHITTFTAHKPTTRFICEMYYSRGPAKICNLRPDSLAQMLTRGNVHAGSKVVLVETCAGVLLGAVMERMAGIGSLVHIYFGGCPGRAAALCYNFPQKYWDSIYSYPIEQVALLNKAGLSSHSTLTTESSAECMDAEEAAKKEMDIDEETEQDTSNSAKRIEDRDRRRQNRQQEIAKARAVLEQADMDCLLIASKYHPTSIALALLEFLAPSRPFAIFCPHQEPLIDCYTKLREAKKYILLTITETWFREYQVMTNRTHPCINMNGAGGYLLTGTRVED